MYRTRHSQKATCIDISTNTYQISPIRSSSSSSNTYRRHCSSNYSIKSCTASYRSFVEDIISTVGIWLHSIGPLAMFLLFAVMFYILNILFGVILFGINMSYHENDCIEGWSELDNKNIQVKNLLVNFDLAFTLGWTSFTTVGYGNISPSIQRHCRLIRLFSSFTSFCGILYFGFCSALMFVKIQNTYSKCPATFSSSVCLLYGDGCQKEAYKPISDEKIHRDHDEKENSGMHSITQSLDIQNSHDTHNTSPSTTETILPNPILEFRIVHKDSNKKIQDPIVDASLSCAVGIVQSSNRPHSFIQSYNEISDTSVSKTHPSFNMMNSTSIMNQEGRQKEQLNHNINNIITESSKQNKLSQNEVTCDNTIADEQGRTEESIQRFHNMNIYQTFEQVKLYPDKCPLFSSVWRIRHVMDISSPFLKENVKEKILHNGGRWPSDINDYESIRSAIIPFQTLSVTLSGTSAISMKTVFMTKSYRFEDVFIGWQPVNLYNVMINDKSSELVYHIDLGSIHNIIPQNGGGQEPIIDADP